MPSSGEIITVVCRLEMMAKVPTGADRKESMWHDITDVTLEPCDNRLLRSREQ